MVQYKTYYSSGLSGLGRMDIQTWQACPRDAAPCPNSASWHSHNTKRCEAPEMFRYEQSVDAFKQPQLSPTPTSCCTSVLYQWHQQLRQSLKSMQCPCSAFFLWSPLFLRSSLTSTAKPKSSFFLSRVAKRKKNNHITLYLKVRITKLPDNSSQKALTQTKGFLSVTCSSLEMETGWLQIVPASLRASFWHGFLTARATPMRERTCTGLMPCKLPRGSKTCEHCIQAPHRNARPALAAGKANSYSWLQAGPTPLCALQHRSQGKQSPYLQALFVSYSVTYHHLKHYSSNSSLTTDLQLHDLMAVLAGRKTITQQKGAGDWSRKIKFILC